VDKRVAIALLLAGVVVVGVVIARPKSKNTVPAAPPATTMAVKSLYDQAVAARRNNDTVTAKKYYQEILVKYPDADNASEVQKELENLNMQMIFSRTTVPGKTVMHEVAAGESLIKIAKKYGTTVDFIRRCNSLKGDTIHLGQKLRIWTGKFNIYVDKSQNKLYLKDGADLIKIYSVSTGANNSTPVGTFKITTKLENPVWFNKGAVVPPESPENVLGTRWLGFDLAGYGIHGTVEPDKIGQQVTAGCVRMRNEEVEELYSIIPLNTEVTIVD